MNIDESKIYLIYTKNSKKPVEIFRSCSREGALGYFKQHSQAKYCGISEISNETVATLKTGMEIEFKRIGGFLESIDRNILCL